MDYEMVKKNWERGLWGQAHIDALKDRGIISSGQAAEITATAKTDFTPRRLRKRKHAHK